MSIPFEHAKQRPGEEQYGKVLKIWRVYRVNNPIHARNMVRVASQPIILSAGDRANFPITFLFDVIRMMTTTSGPAVIPFTIAAQNSALMGSTWVKVSRIPASVTAARVV